MYSINFPDMFSTTKTKLSTDKDATLINLKLLLSSEAGSLYGDPYYGTKIRRYIHEQNNIVLHDLIIDDIYLAITTFMPQIHIRRKDILLKAVNQEIYVTINCINKLDNEMNSYEIQLLNSL